MKKYLKYGFVIAIIVILVAIIWNLATPKTPTIESNVFTVFEWNTPEYIESNVYSVNDGIVIKKMESDNPLLFDCLIEVNNSDGRTSLVYYVDTIEHPVGEQINSLKGVWIASYNYEESVDMVRRIPVYLSFSGIELLKNK